MTLQYSSVAVAGFNKVFFYFVCLKNARACVIMIAALPNAIYCKDWNTMRKLRPDILSLFIFTGAKRAYTCSSDRRMLELDLFLRFQDDNVATFSICFLS